MQKTGIVVLFIVIVMSACVKKKDSKVQEQTFIPVGNGINLYVESYGNSNDEACLFISGAGANSTFWSEHLCDSLVKNGFFVIKYDHRDFGFSTKINWYQNPYDFMQLTRDAIAILDYLGVKKAHVVGHSMGGFIAQQLAIHYPERIHSLVSISSSTNSPSVPLPPEKTWEVYMSQKPTNNYEQDLNGFLRVWEYLNGTAPFDKELAIAYTQNLYKRQDIIGALGETHVKAQASLTDRSEELKKVKIPCLVIHGEQDYAVDKYGGIQTASVIENAELILIPQMGHIPFNYEILERFENEIIGFLIRKKDAE